MIFGIGNLVAGGSLDQPFHQMKIREVRQVNCNGKVRICSTEAGGDVFCLDISIVVVKKRIVTISYVQFHCRNEKGDADQNEQ